MSKKSDIEIMKDALLEIIQNSKSEKAKLEAAKLLLEIKKEGPPSLWLE